jgi:chemotaxis protein MotB
MNKTFFSFLIVVFLGSCVPPGLLITSEQKVAQLNSDIQILQKKYNDSIALLANKQKDYLSQISELKENVAKIKNAGVVQVDTFAIEKLIVSDLANKLEVSGIGKNVINSYHYDSRNTISNNGFINQLKDQLKNYDNKFIYIKVDNTVTSIELSDKLFFAQGSSVLTKQSIKVLDKIAGILKNNPNVEVTVEGHTDNVKVRIPNKLGLVDNLDLSLRRSAYVARLLTKKYGISPKSITVAGRGDNLPIANNKTRDGKNQNRRIRILLAPKISDLLK